MWQQALRFGLIGALATLVHVVMGAILIQSDWPPLIANAFAFLIAFLVSFVGHLGYSFADQEPAFASSLWRFGLVAIAGFLCNEALLAALLTRQWLPDVTALGVSTASAAVLTFSFSKYWAFRRKALRPAPSRNTTL
ncbi:MAG: GtrA family protein [Paracoccus sp. (in: a-proteobacteria)]|nr:GtrA family protein [Paracoccus sp. (in: a-proteobacteria)]